MVAGCGINAWETNSQIVHLESGSPLGPFAKTSVTWPTFAHEPSVARSRNGTWVMLYSAYPLDAARLCTGCVNGTSVHAVAPTHDEPPRHSLT